MYSLLFRFFVLAGVDGEAAHRLAASGLRVLTAIPGMRRMLWRALGPRDPGLRVRALGLEFPSPLGLAAGVDSSASWFEGLGALGWGFVEVGTITALPQPGNPGPRVFRLPADRAILNRRGFPNDGARAAAGRLALRPAGPIVGVNIGKSRVVDVQDADEDYRASLRLLAPHADYLVLNVSSPNTPGLRDMQSPERLRRLIDMARAELAAMHAPGSSPPVLVKIAPDLKDSEIDEICDLALDAELDGIVAVNTTVSRAGLTDPGALPAGVLDGGVSGAPLAPRALQVLRRVRARVGERMTIVSVGGIASADDAWERILAGATLVQAYTAFVYGGPMWPHRVNRGLSRCVRAAGGGSIGDYVGAGM
jgi:dihydroorotate dehydrogenase